MALAAEGLVLGPEEGYDDPPPWTPAQLAETEAAIRRARAMVKAAGADERRGLNDGDVVLGDEPHDD
jgi:hypothetical protein